MDFIEKLRTLAARIEKQKDKIQTEEATKQAFVLPFIQILGYDIWNPDEVIPEFTADVGIKKGEKVDYAIMQDGKTIMLIECKSAKSTLDINHSSQLFRYFSVVEARVAILTNGIHYQFFTDVDNVNKMDSKPFLELNLLDLKDNQVAQVKKMAKESFDVEDMLSAAVELKYTGQIKTLLTKQLEDPDEEFVKFFASQIYEGRLTQTIKDQFSELTKRAFSQFLRDRFDAKLSLAFGGNRKTKPAEEVDPNEPKDLSENSEISDEPKDDGIVTTEEEIQAYMIVKAVLASEVPLERVHGRDTKSYFGVLLDDNNRKPLCRLHFNRAQWYLGLFDEEKNETRVPIAGLDEIYQYADQTKATVGFYG